MANIVITAARVAPIDIVEAQTKPSAVAITAGQWVTEDANGFWKLALATSSANAGDRRAIALSSTEYVGMAVTAMYKGKLDIGDGLSALAYDAPLYLSDTAGATADAAGTASVVVGTVTSGHAESPASKLLQINN
jgi:hypothetical protein